MEFNAGEAWNEKQILSSYSELSTLTGVPQLAEGKYYFVDLENTSSPIIPVPSPGYFNLIKDILQIPPIFPQRALRSFIDIKEHVNEMLDSISLKEKDVIDLRYLALDGEKKSYKSIGKKYYITGERVRQIEKIALRKLRHPKRSRKIRALFGTDYEDLDYYTDGLIDYWDF